MAHEELMQTLPKGVERVSVQGPFLVRSDGGPPSVIVLNPILVSIGGPSAKADAIALAEALNTVWREHIHRKT
jgi:hypothetical protein